MWCKYRRKALQLLKLRFVRDPGPKWDNSGWRLGATWVSRGEQENRIWSELNSDVK